MSCWCRLGTTRWHCPISKLCVKVSVCPCLCIQSCGCAAVLKVWTQAATKSLTCALKWWTARLSGGSALIAMFSPAYPLNLAASHWQLSFPSVETDWSPFQQVRFILPKVTWDCAFPMLYSYSHMMGLYVHMYVCICMYMHCIYIPMRLNLGYSNEVLMQPNAAVLLCSGHPGSLLHLHCTPSPWCCITHGGWYVY